MGKKWVGLLLAVVVTAGGWWYWSQRPANAQAVISGARKAANVNDVMTVESVMGGGESLAGRSISIVNARVTNVTGPSTFWVVGGESEPLLVVIAPTRETGLKLAPGERVSIDGVVRDTASKFAVSSADAAQVAKARLHLFATEVRPIR